MDIALTLPPAQADEPGVLVARQAVFIAFIVSGFAFASWASRIPAVRDTLRLNPGQLGLVLLSIAVGSVIALPLAGVVVTRIGAARTIAATSVLLGVGLAVVAIGHHHVGAVVAGLLLVGAGNGAWDVAMNVEGAAVEQRLGRSIMSRFHAGFSFGTVAGALVGAPAVATHVPVTAHLLAVAVGVVAVVPLSVRGFLPHVAVGPGSHERTSHPMQAWTEPRTLLIGVCVLAAAFTEGTGNDWLGVAVIDGYHSSPAVGPLTLAIFLAAMTTGRWFGSGLLDHYGRVPVLRACVIAALAGLLLVIFGGALPLAMLGAVLWGLGASLGFPVGMSAAADDPRRSAARVSVVASIGYLAFLAGPPLIGLLGDHVGVLHSLTLAAGVLAIGLVASGACRPLDDAG